MMDTPKNNNQCELIYKTVGEKQIKLAFLPPVENVYEKAPVYFIIPGGGWHMEKKEDMISCSQISVDEMRKKGFAVVAPDYRVTKEGADMIDIISDCFDAARYIAHFSDVLKTDKDKFILSGHSAGGHLALMLAYAPQDMFNNGSVLNDKFGVKAVMPMSPPTVLYRAGIPCRTSDLEIVPVLEQTPEIAHKVSPYDYVTSDCPPTFLSAGTSDNLVYSASSELLYDKLLENNVETKLMLSLGGGHLFEQMHKTIEPSPSMTDIQNALIEFALKHI